MAVSKFVQERKSTYKRTTYTFPILVFRLPRSDKEMIVQSIVTEVVNKAVTHCQGDVSADSSELNAPNPSAPSTAALSAVGLTAVKAVNGTSKVNEADSCQVCYQVCAHPYNFQLLK